MKVHGSIKPKLDPEFVPAVLWNRAYRKQVDSDEGSEPLGIALSRPDGTVYTYELAVLPHVGEYIALNTKYV